MDTDSANCERNGRPNAVACFWLTRLPDGPRRSTWFEMAHLSQTDTTTMISENKGDQYMKKLLMAVIVVSGLVLVGCGSEAVGASSERARA
jgi:hypothetical protein